MQIWIVIIGVAIFAILLIIAIENTRSKAKAKYQLALAELRKEPNNPILRQRALELGRQYSNLCRNRTGVTIYDEAAIKNDLDAVTAGAAKVMPPAPMFQLDTPSSPEVRLRKLTELKNKMLITDDEYNSRRAKILDEI